MEVKKLGRDEEGKEIWVIDSGYGVVLNNVSTENVISYLEKYAWCLKTKLEYEEL